uniref:Uncharacterized protein n=1 Tax=Pseudomonas phage Orisa03 TaxID=3138542 RepID=A0AAU6W2A4_9VIRU
MSEITRAVIGMPFEMAMENDLSRRQFHSRAQNLLAENEALQSQLRAFTGSAYPVSTDINERGYNWSEAWLDEALVMAKELHS